MNLNSILQHPSSRRKMKFKTALKMKITAILLLATTLQVGAIGVAQKVNVTFRRDNLKKVFREIEKQTHISFVYGNEQLESTNKVTLSLQGEKLETALNLIFKNQPLDYTLLGNHVVIKEKVNATEINEKAIAPVAIAITGKVTNEKGEPLPGVSILIKGTKQGTTTDADGKYAINVADTKTILAFSFVGFASQEITVGNKTQINVSLKTESKALDEIVVVGYGTQKKTDLTGSVGVVKSKDIANKPISQISQALQGKVAGVFVNIGQSDPGDDKGTIRIRGVGTLNDPNPLTLVDGIEAPINSVNASDVESITVLKDAASAAIYGSRAANGVVVITTKRGSFDKAPIIEYSSIAGISEATKLFDQITDGKTYLELINEAKINSKVNTIANPFITQAQIDDYAKKSPNTNWIKEIFRSAPYLQQSLSLRGGSKSSAYSLSLGQIDQTGLIIGNSHYKRYNVRSNLDFIITDKLKAGASLSYANGEIISAQELSGANFGVGGSREVLIEALRSHPTTPVYDQFGRYADTESTLPLTVRNNAVANANNLKHTQTTREFLGTAFVEYEPIQNLKLKATIATNDQTLLQVEKTPYWNVYDWVTGKAILRNSPGTLKETKGNSINVTKLLQATYEKNIGNHHFKLLGGYNQESFRGGNSGFNVIGFASPDFIFANNASGVPSVFGTEGEWALRSYFGRLDYNYDGRYLFAANFRRDGSSRFGQNNRFGNFPSFSAGWIVSKEKFWNVDFINSLKIRGSWGILGNQNTSLYPYASLVNLGTPYLNFTGASLQTLGNPDLKWEETESTDIGANIGLFNSHLNIEFDLYRKRTSGILFGIDNPGVTGIGSQTIANLSTIENKGLELSANYSGKINNLGFTIGGNITTIKNTVLAINPALTDNADIVFFNDFLRGDGRQVIKRGESINSIYGYKVLGIFKTAEEIAAAPNHATLFPGFAPEPGDFQIADINKDGKIDSNDRTILGKETPGVLYAFNLDLNYKGFDFSAFFQGVADEDKFISRGNPVPFDQDGGVTTEWVNRWTPQNSTSDLPRVFIPGSGYNGRVARLTNSYFLYSKAFLRLKNVQIGYTLPSSILGKGVFKKVYLFVNAKNLLTFSNLPQIDPESAEGLRFSGHALPQAKTFSFGVNVTF